MLLKIVKPSVLGTLHIQLNFKLIIVLVSKILKNNWDRKEQSDSHIAPSKLHLVWVCVCEGGGVDERWLLIGFEFPSD